MMFTFYTITNSRNPLNGLMITEQISVTPRQTPPTSLECDSYSI